MAHTKKPLTKDKGQISKHTTNRKTGHNNIMILVSCPSLYAVQIKQYLAKYGCIFIEDKEEFVDAKGLFAERTPGNMLIGARDKPPRCTAANQLFGNF